MCKQPEIGVHVTQTKCRQNDFKQVPQAEGDQTEASENSQVKERKQSDHY